MRNKFSDEAADYDLEYQRDTDAAWLFRDQHGSGVWLPKSQCEAPSGMVRGKVYEVTVPGWLAADKGLE
jgi:hypothetical protein